MEPKKKNDKSAVPGLIAVAVALLMLAMSTWTQDDKIATFCYAMVCIIVLQLAFWWLYEYLSYQWNRSHCRRCGAYQEPPLIANKCGSCLDKGPAA